MVSRPNAGQVERWNGVGGQHWIDFERAYDRQLAVFGAALLDAAALSGQEHVLDVGCGTGTTTLEAAPQARSVHGVDLGDALIARARERADAAGVTNATFEVADAQTEGYAGFDVVLSRFGVMFFDDRRRALTNLAGAVVPAGRFVAVCWQGLEHNDWMRVPAEALATVVPLGDLAEAGQPGPFAWADPGPVRADLEAAGWDDVTFDPVHASMPLGPGDTLDETVEFVRGNSLGRSALAGVASATEDAALAAVRTALAPHLTPEGVRLDGAAWVVRASRAR